MVRCCVPHTHLTRGRRSLQISTKLRTPSFSGTWVLSEEDFWGGLDDYVSSFRLRSAWGKAGRQPDTFAGVTLYAPEPGPGGQPSVTPDVLGNPDLGPEVSSEIEVGFDAAFLDERISAAFTYYNQEVKDALIDIPVPPTFGFPGAQTVNLGAAHQLGLGAEHEWPDP